MRPPRKSQRSASTHLRRSRRRSSHCDGTNTYADGGKYVGEYKDGKKHGEGTYTLANGDKYVGQWKDDKKHGQGTLTDADGNEYVGQWHDKPHGLGKYTFANGKVHHDGEWEDGRPKGECALQ